MEHTNAIIDFLKFWGFPAAVCLILLWAFIIWPRIKKKGESDDGGDDAKQLREVRFENLRDHYIELKGEVDKMKASEAQEEVRFSVIENEQLHFKETLTEMKSEMKDGFNNIYKLVGDLKTVIIQGKNS